MEPSRSRPRELTYPDRDWWGFLRNHFGPSMMWALLGIGASHVVLAPSLGARYGFFAVWLVLLVYAVKYGGWDLGIRYNYGVGRNPVDGYADLPGPGRWGQWVTLGVYLVGWTVILSAVGTGAAAFAAELIPGWSRSVSYLVLIGTITPLLVVSRYNLIETVLKGFILGLALLIVVGVVYSPPSLHRIQTTILRVPDLGSATFLSLFAALAGYTPTGLSTTASIGSWSLAKRQGARKLPAEARDSPEYHDYIRAWIEVGRRDFNIAYGFSLILMLIMISLACVVLYPNPPTDRNIAVAIGQLLGDSLGEPIRYAVLLGAFCALFSTVITVLDGASRVCADTLGLIFPSSGSREGLRRGFVVGMALTSLVPIGILGHLPVTLVVFSASLMAILQVFFYGANYYIVRNHLPEALQPNRLTRFYYLGSLGAVVLFGIMGAFGKLGLLG